jgi:anti-sigma factor RsiW
MSDCSNVEMRELLPEYLHGSLTPPDRARVETHLATCAECTAELETLRAVNALYARTPVVETARIVSALPRPIPARALRLRSRIARWQIAAAVTMISLGGLSLAVARRYSGRQVVPGDTTFVVAPVSAPPDAPDSAPPAGGPSLTLSSNVSDLDTPQLEALLASIENLEAVPVAEPRRVSPSLSIAETTR